MFNFKNMEEFDTVNFGDAQNVTFESLQAAIEVIAGSNGIPVDCHMEEGKDGLFGDTYDVLILANPEHRGEYFYFAITMTKQGRIGVLHIYRMGTSKQGKKFAKGGLAGIGRSKTKLQDEQLYYDSLISIVHVACGDN